MKLAVLYAVLAIVFGALAVLADDDLAAAVLTLAACMWGWNSGFRVAFEALR